MKCASRILLLLLIFSSFNLKSTQAQNSPTGISDSCSTLSQPESLDKKNIKSANDNDANQTTDKKIISTTSSSPTLWWAKEQFDPFEGRLINNWLAFPQKKQINLIVNWQLWTLLDYLQRYRFINQFGTVVRDYGYNLYVLNQQQQCLAIYEYNPYTNPPKWNIHLEESEKNSFQVEPKTN